MSRPPWVPLILALSSLLPCGAAEWTVQPTGPDSLILIWRNQSPGREGADTQVRSAAIAVPPGAAPEASLEILEERAYRGRPQAPGNLGDTPGSARGDSRNRLVLSPASRYRDLDVAALTFHPLEAGNMAAAARIRVAFKGRSARSTPRPAFPPAAESPAEKFLASWILNYGQSRGFRSAEPPALAKAAGAGRTPATDLPRERLVIGTLDENIAIMDYDFLRKAGVPINRINPRNMRMFRDGKEVPIYVHGEQDGSWDMGDYVEFVGARAAGPNTFRSMFAATASFILVWDGGRFGLRAPAVPAASRVGGPLPVSSLSTAAPAFKARIHMEEDLEVLRIGSTSVEEVADLGALVQETELQDFWLWKRMGAEKDAMEIAFKLENAPAPFSEGAGNPAAAFRMAVNLKGVTNNPSADPDHHLKFILNGHDISLVGGVHNDAVWEGQESYTWISPALNPSVLKTGDNILVVQKVNDLRTIDGKLVEIQDAFLNFLELEFPATYAVPSDRLRFSNSFPDSLGLKRFTLTGFTRNAVSIWDAQGRKLVGYHAASQGLGFDITFQDSLAGPTRYIAAALDRREIPTAYLDTLPDDLLSPAQGADYLVITQKELLGGALDSLLEFRRKQGLRCRVVTANHIYQAFGDGSMDPAALRRFVAHAYRNWPRPAPAYLLLLGETSLWFDKRGGIFQRNIVPTHLINIQGWGVASNDDYFAKVSGDDDVPDLFVGRIPVATREALSKVVAKTLALENRRPQGHWSNKAFLISGYEASFSLVNDQLRAIAVANDRQYSRLDLYPASPHYKTPAQRADFYDQLDSGFNLVNFVGHGGGSVWSDAGVLTLTALLEGRLRAAFPIPLVSSITCLTGYFEDVNLPSLGEEMIRLEKAGAANFYGASGYISNLAGEALAGEIMRASTGNAYGTTGAVIHQAETMVRLRTGNAFLPILGEFNLLGDPALKLAFPAREGGLHISPQTLAGTGGLEAKNNSLALAQADGVMTLFLGDSAESSAPVRISGGDFSFQHAFAGAPGPVQNGKALIHYWNEKEARVASSSFSTLDWLIDSLAIEPADAAPGDSVRIRFRLGTAYARTELGGGIAAYVMGGEQVPLFPGENQATLESSDGIHVRTAGKVALSPAPAELAHPRLYVAFRLSVQVFDAQGQAVKVIPDLSSRIYSLPLSDLARLSFPPKAFHLPVQDTLGVWVRFRNHGLGSASGVRIALAKDAKGPFPSFDTLAYPGTLRPGGWDSLFFPLADSLVSDRALIAYLAPSREGELALQGNTQDTVFHKVTRLPASASDTLRLAPGGPFLLQAPGAGRARRVFAEKVALATLPAHLSPAAGTTPMEAYRVESPGLAPGSMILGVDPPPEVPAKPGAVRPYWHYRELQGASWLKLDTAASAPSAWSASAFRNGLYALLLNQDAAAPLIQLSSRGQILLPDDYVPLNTPINIVIRDGEGVDLALHPPVVTVREQDLDSTSRADDGGALFPTLARIAFLPKRRVDRDSIAITASDVSGNVSRRSITYRLGDDLAIRNLGSYPNPFADTAVFVYSLTDFCDKVELKIYSRAGRPVRTLEERNAVGYREVIWDGRTDGGRAIANGLYFLKVTAQSGKKETSKTFKLFKKQRK